MEYFCSHVLCPERLEITALPPGSMSGREQLDSCMCLCAHVCACVCAGVHPSPPQGAREGGLRIPSLMLGRIEGRRRWGRQRIRWLDGITDSNGHEFEQTLGGGEGQGSLVCCSPCGCKESDMTERLSNNLSVYPLTPWEPTSIL